MMSNKSKSDLFLSLQSIPSQDPMLTKSDRRCLFTRLNSKQMQLQDCAKRHILEETKSKASIVTEENHFL